MEGKQESRQILITTYLLTVVSICRVMGRRALSLGRLGAAIWWGVRSRDAAFTSHLAHQVPKTVVLKVLSVICM